MKTIDFTPRGVCSRNIKITLSDDNVIESVAFTGGCAGNTSGICKLVKGMKAEEVIDRLKGTRCGLKSTSCPDQLAKALENAMQANKQ